MTNKKKIFFGLIVLGVLLIVIGVMLIFNVFPESPKQDNPNQEDSETLSATEIEYRKIEQNLMQDEICDYMRELFENKNGHHEYPLFCQFIEDGPIYQYEIFESPSEEEGVSYGLYKIDRDELLSYILEKRGPVIEDDGIYMEGSTE